MLVTHLQSRWRDMARRDGGVDVEEEFETSGHTSWFGFYRERMRRSVLVIHSSLLRLYVSPDTSLQELQRLVETEGSRPTPAEQKWGWLKTRNSRLVAAAASFQVRASLCNCSWHSHKKMWVTSRNLDCPPLPNCTYPEMPEPEATVAQHLCEGAVLVLVREPVKHLDTVGWAIIAGTSPM